MYRFQLIVKFVHYWESYWEDLHGQQVKLKPQNFRVKCHRTGRKLLAMYSKVTERDMSASWQNDIWCFYDEVTLEPVDMKDKYVVMEVYPDE